MAGPQSLCAGCRAVVTPGQPRWTQREPEEVWHWICAEAAGLTASPLYRRFMLPQPRPARVHTSGQPLPARSRRISAGG